MTTRIEPARDEVVNRTADFVDNTDDITARGVSVATVKALIARIRAQTAPAEVVETRVWTQQDAEREHEAFEKWWKERGYEDYPDCYSLTCQNAMHSAWQEASRRSTPTQAEAKEVVGEPTMLPDHARFELTHGEMLLSDDGPWVRYVEFITALKVQEDSYLGWLKIARETIEKLETSTPTQAEAKEAALAPFKAFYAGGLERAPDDFPITAGSSMAKRQLTVGDLRALLTGGEAP